MPTFYLDDKRRKRAPFLIHRYECLFRRERSTPLGEFSWPSQALRVAQAQKQDVGRCELCCLIPPIKRKKPRQTRLARLAEKLRRAHARPEEDGAMIVVAEGTRE